MCMKQHEGVCQSRGLGCYKCGRFGHVNKDCPQGTSSLCFHYNQLGYKKADCLELTRGAVRAPTPSTLRITNGREGRVDVPMVRIQALQS